MKPLQSLLVSPFRESFKSSPARVHTLPAAIPEQCKPQSEYLLARYDVHRALSLIKVLIYLVGG